jgi:hypothetical protein
VEKEKDNAETQSALRSAENLKEIWIATRMSEVRATKSIDKWTEDVTGRLCIITHVHPERMGVSGEKSPEF